MTSDAHPLDYWPEDDTGDDRVDSLALIDRARAALVRAESLTDIGAVMEIAERGRRYAKAAKLGLDAENYAAALRVQAERKAGEYLRETPKHRGQPDVVRSQNGTAPPRLSDLAITKRESADWQALAALPEHVFSEHVEKTKTARRPLTTSGLVDIARKLARRERIATLPPVMLTRPDVRIEVADARCLPLEDETVDLIVTSPPYALDVEYADGGDVSPDEWWAFMVDWLREALRVTKPHGRLALNIPLDVSKPFGRPTYAQAVVAATDIVGWEYAATIDWAEGNTTKGGYALGSHSSRRPHHVSRVEHIAILSKGPMAASSENPDDITPNEFEIAGRGPWDFSGESRPHEDHPAAYPLELPRRLIPYLCRVGDVVLDPFVGSGTTAIAALERGRHFIGFDRSPTYVESTRRRIDTELPEQGE